MNLIKRIMIFCFWLVVFLLYPLSLDFFKIFIGYSSGRDDEFFLYVFVFFYFFIFYFSMKTKTTKDFYLLFYCCLVSFSQLYIYWDVGIDRYLYLQIFSSLIAFFMYLLSRVNFNIPIYLYFLMFLLLFISYEDEYHTSSIGRCLYSKEEFQVFMLHLESNSIDYAEKNKNKDGANCVFINNPKISDFQVFESGDVKVDNFRRDSRRGLAK